MNDIENLLKATFEEMQKIMSAKTVVGEPIAVEGRTLIPLVSIGMGFGAGGGSGKGKDTGDGGGAGGGVGIKPVALIVIDQEGVRVEQLKSALPSVMEKLADNIPKLAESLPKVMKKEEGSNP
jgi:uncharacterized spore protein YtfJ